jgi:hypothetical protein
MNKTNKGIEVNLSVVAVSAILVASLFVMSSSRFMPDAMAQNATNQTGAAVGGAANQTGAAVGGAANQTGMMMNETGGAANQTGGGGAANQTGGGGAANQTGGGGAANQTGGGGAANQTAMVMIPQSSMMTMMDNVQTAMGAVGDDDDAKMALESVDQELRSAATAAGMSVPTTSDTGGDTDTDTDTGGDTDTDTGGDTDTDTDDGGDTSDTDDK